MTHVTDGQAGDDGLPESVRGKNVEQMLEEAGLLMEQGCEPTSALKQAASDNGIEFGTEAMGDFVRWGLGKLEG